MKPENPSCRYVCLCVDPQYFTKPQGNAHFAGPLLASVIVCLSLTFKFWETRLFCDNLVERPNAQRKDDTSEALVKRLQGYHGETVPILEHYRPHGVVRAVNANQQMDGVWSEILAALQRKGK